MKLDRDALVQAFLADSEENLTTMEDALMVLEARPDDDEILRAIFRGAHTLKGNAATLDYAELSQLGHAVEDVLDQMRKHRLHASSDLVSLLLRSVDLMRRMVPTVSSTQRSVPFEHPRLLAELSRWIETTGAPAAGAGGKAAGASPAPAAPGAVPPARTLRVEVDRLDQALNLVGEIAIARGRLLESLSANAGAGRGDPLEIHLESDRLFTDLQDLIMKIRMVPLGPTCRQYARMVRDTASTHGKVASLLVEGGDVEVDTTVIEHLRDPLTHIVRNAISHGIETPSVRRERGKDPSGLIVVRARREASNIMLEVSDDGAGIDRKRVMEVARARGLVPEAEPTRDEDILRLVFEPGFSTSRHDDDLSGRGVGMDIVRHHIEALRGSVELQSVFGYGTTVVMRIPLTLAIIPGFAVSVGDDSYVIPLDSVIECGEVPQGVLAGPDGSLVLDLRGHPLPCLRLREFFSIQAPPPVHENVVVVRSGEINAGLIVDSLHGEGQAVVKPLGRLLGDIPGVAGSTIRGSGRVALILDVPAILRRVIASMVPTAGRLPAGGPSVEER